MGRARSTRPLLAPSLCLSYREGSAKCLMILSVSARNGTVSVEDKPVRGDQLQRPSCTLRLQRLLLLTRPRLHRRRRRVRLFSLHLPLTFRHRAHVEGGKAMPTGAPLARMARSPWRTCSWRESSAGITMVPGLPMVGLRLAARYQGKEVPQGKRRLRRHSRSLLKHQSPAVCPIHLQWSSRPCLTRTPLETLVVLGSYVAVVVQHPAGAGHGKARKEGPGLIHRQGSQ
mmetsp:Transcript_11295/g.41326  ORF Transcript_11295/g.41326 Transcript_11295/m.41326 type:complete len:229 (+) Transcript_11295:55-741(+)